MRTPYFAANWKMNKGLRDIGPYFSALETSLEGLGKTLGKDFDVLIAPPATHLVGALGSKNAKDLWIGAQNCGTANSGAFTGETSPQVLNEMGCGWVILGHSERRHVFGETDELISRKLYAALEQGLRAIYCVGEKIEARRAGDTVKVVGSQLDPLKLVTPGQWERVVIAYEPVWAIGTGETATPEQAEEVHLFIRNWVKDRRGNELAERVRILYGGSAKPDNAGVLMKQPNVDGLLVGSASLDGAKFADLIQNGLG